MRYRLSRVVMWIGLAAVATYLLDPDRGEHRRKELRKRFNRMRKAGA